MRIFVLATLNSSGYGQLETPRMYQSHLHEPAETRVASMRSRFVNSQRSAFVLDSFCSTNRQGWRSETSCRGTEVIATPQTVPQQVKVATPHCSSLSSGVGPQRSTSAIRNEWPCWAKSKAQETGSGDHAWRSFPSFPAPFRHLSLIPAILLADLCFPAWP